MKITREEAQANINASHWDIDNPCGKLREYVDKIFDYIERSEAEKKRQHLQINDLSTKLIDSEFENKELKAPQYRAKKIDSDDTKSDMVNYAYGMLFYKNKHIPDVMLGNKHELVYYIQTPNTGEFKIDPSTLAIHFPDRLDSDNKPIFASLSEDGKGGDLFNTSLGLEVLITNGLKMYTLDKDDGFEDYQMPEILSRLKVAGIQE